MKKGRIELAIGPMFAGKTSWLIDKLEGKKPEEILCVRYFLDTRYATDSIATHDGKKFKAIAAKSEKDIIKALNRNPNITTLGLDELQFFKPTISKLLLDLREKELSIFVAGLNVDHNNVMWDSTKATIPIADKVHEFIAICAVCGKKNATITNRKGQRDARIIIGGSELYESLCKKDYFKAMRTLKN